MVRHIRNKIEYFVMYEQNLYCQGISKDYSRFFLKCLKAVSVCSAYGEVICMNNSENCFF